MRNLGLSFLLAANLAAVGCAGLSPERMVPAASATTAAPAVSFSEVIVTGGQESTFGGAQMIGEELYGAALTAALTDAGFDIADGASGYTLSADISGQYQSEKNLAYTAGQHTRYRIIDTATDRVVWRTGIHTNHRSTTLSGNKRTVTAREGAVRNNLKALQDELAAWDGEPTVYSVAEALAFLSAYTEGDTTTATVHADFARSHRYFGTLSTIAGDIGIVEAVPTAEVFDDQLRDLASSFEPGTPFADVRRYFTIVGAPGFGIVWFGDDGDTMTYEFGNTYSLIAAEVELGSQLGAFRQRGRILGDLEDSVWAGQMTLPVTAGRYWETECDMVFSKADRLLLDNSCQPVGAEQIHPKATELLIVRHRDTGQSEALNERFETIAHLEFIDGVLTKADVAPDTEYFEPTANLLAERKRRLKAAQQ